MVSDELEHYGILRKSGRYPWGSGKDPFQRSQMFYQLIDELKAKGLTSAEIAKVIDADYPGKPAFNATALRQTTSIANNQLRAAEYARAYKMRFEKKMSITEIAKTMGKNESTIRSLLDPEIKARQEVLTTTINSLRDQVDQHRFVDIGAGAENYVGVSRDKLLTAVAVLQDEGYRRYYLNPEQIGMKGQKTTVLVLGAKDSQFPEIANNPENLHTIGFYMEDGEIPRTIQKPRPVDSSKVHVVYGPDGGENKDGLIELRRGVPELDMGNSTYAQVRILVDGTHYIKGMAVVRDDLPDGVDIQFNTSKKDTGNKLDALKPVEKDPINPFGSSIRKQKTYLDAKGKEQITALNIVNDEGAWDEWGKDLSSQFMSKQPLPLIKQQLKAFSDIRQTQLDDIMALTNPTLKQMQLQEFSEKADADAVSLQALALPRTRQKTLIPIPEMKPTEVYAPGYEHGERVVLVRHPHGGRFELPDLIVNNKNRAAMKVLGTSPMDAIGINHKVAEQLSGADFDGDTVLVIPNNDGRVKTSRPLKELQGFDPKKQYAGYEGMKVMSNTQAQMGSISNLITDMTIKGAVESELARAVMHSMVVIDAEKHKLNYKQSEIDRGIKALKAKYQQGGASTLISRAKADDRKVLDRKPRPVGEGGFIDPKTGELHYVPTNKSYTKVSTNKRTGEVKTEEIFKTISVPRMRLTNDARTLMSSKTGTEVEVEYASFANAMKAMANRARLAMINTPNLKRDPLAAKTYAPEVERLNAALKVARMNAPLERKAQIVAAAKTKLRIEADPSLANEPKRLKKARAQELLDARDLLGAKKEKIYIAPREWEAIQAGAISHTPLMAILNNADPQQVKEYATPMDRQALTGARLSRAKSMINMGYTQEEVAQALGVSVSSVQALLASRL